MANKTKLIVCIIVKGIFRVILLTAKQKGCYKVGVENF